MKPDVKVSELNKAKEAIQHFILSYSTRMKGPLQTIYDTIVKMENRVRADELQSVGNSVKHMEKVLLDLRGELEKSERVIQYRRFCLSALVHEVAEEFKNTAGENHIAIAVEALSPLLIVNDYVGLQMILKDILTNIIAGRPEDSIVPVKIQLRGNTRCFLMDICDTSFEWRDEAGNNGKTLFHRDKVAVKRKDFRSASDGLQRIGAEFSIARGATGGTLFSISIPNHFYY